MGVSGGQVQNWRVLAASVRGTAHLLAGNECQDAALWRVVSDARDVPVLLLAASDGAGSAAHSAEASRLVCAGLLRDLERLCTAEGFKLSHLNAAALLSGLNTELENHAEEHGYRLRDLACTLLGGVIFPDAAWFVQVGDGAIVLQQSGEPLRLHVWPDSGEYTNQTYFVTDVPPGHVHAAVYSGEWQRAALLTDGLQGLALSNASRTPFAPFFEPVFATLEGAGDGWAATLPGGLEQFLNSPAVNARTSDDKTLLLACRMPRVPAQADEEALLQGAGPPI